LITIGMEVWIIDLVHGGADLFKYAEKSVIIERIFDNPAMRTQYAVYLPDKEITYAKLVEEKDIFLSKCSAAMAALRLNKQRVEKLKKELEYLTKEVSILENVFEEY
jgi:hypothetical protein